MNKKIIIYYSYTGHTRIIANMIREKINCDILELKMKAPYSNDYQTVVDEQQNNEHAKDTPEIEPLNVDLNNYDEIILGTPVWWYTIAPPVRTFLMENDLKGKVIKPYATNAGWLGRTFKEIESLCKESTVKDEMNILFDEDYSTNLIKTNQKEIENWINRL